MNEKRVRIVIDIQEIVEAIWQQLTQAHFDFDYRKLGKAFSKTRLEEVVVKDLRRYIYVASKPPATPYGYRDGVRAFADYAKELGLDPYDFEEAVGGISILEETTTMVYDYVYDLPYNDWLLWERGPGLWMLEDTGDARIKEWERDHLDENGNYVAEKEVKGDDE